MLEPTCRKALFSITMFHYFKFVPFVRGHRSTRSVLCRNCPGCLNTPFCKDAIGNVILSSFQNRNGSATVDHVKAAQQRYADVIQENRNVRIVIGREG